MKNLKKYITALGLLTAVVSCDNLQDLNVNPSFPVDVSAQALLPPIEQQMAVGLQFDNRYLGRYVQYFSNATSGNEWDRLGYVANNDQGGDIWKMAYFTLGLNVTRMQEKAIAEERHDITGISKVIRAWSWQVATDYHSELIDFDQAFTQRMSFDYVSQDKVYAEVLRLINEGVTDLARTDGKVSATYAAVGDKMYNGDRAKWTKFAWGVVARNLNNQINKSTYDPAAVIAACDKSLASNADNAIITYNGTVSADTNFNGPGRNNFANFRQTDFMVRVMNGTVFTGAIDPRMSRILAPSIGLSETAPASAANPDPTKYTFVGNPLNVTASSTAGPSRIPNLWGTFVAGTVTTPGRYIFRDKANFPLMTYAEIQFIKAEAAFIKGDKTLALAAYKKGIDASIDFVNLNTVVSTTYPITTTITATEKTAFLANVNVVPAEANLTMSHIILQKYISLFGFGDLEAWTDMRKYHYDNVNIYKTMAIPTGSGLFADNGGKLPYRVRPRFNSEYVWNFASLQAIGADKVDYHTVEMWYSKP
jgi:hypothetical protein